jgi:superfamily II DNA or RNA helicase
VDGVFDRIRQILDAARGGSDMQIATDLIPLLRHALRRQELQTQTSVRLRVPSTPNWPSRERWADYSIQAVKVSASQFLLEAAPWSPTWLEDADKPAFEDAFAERSVRLDWRRPIDPFLEIASGFQTYVSPGQREAVRSALLMKPGETLIVSLPTGSGKSFVAQAQVLVRGMEGGLTVCVVPTTALVLDQARQMADLLKRRHPGREAPALAWHAGLHPEERKSIKLAIRQGRQGILYCSPEAVTGALLPALYDAARGGLIDTLVVDEAHLVSAWGDGFRPAFQMLAGIRRGLLAASADRRFRTILMSATLTPDTIETIDALFGPATRTHMVASIYLRPEPQYWVHRENNEARKHAKVLEAVRNAPRPFVLYVTKRDDARRWLKDLRDEGLSRIACFHGETPDTERLRIIDYWAKNNLDGVVATSAFGVGIDKSDVRTVLHVAVPETLDRFYQEVGRGGRDGCASCSLLIHSDVDRELADRLASPALLGEDLAFERWSAMFERAKLLDPLGGLLEVSLDVVPPRLHRQTDYNASWNMRTLIMMARARILQLESRPPAMIAQSEGETDTAFEIRNEEHWADYFKQTVVKINDAGHRNQAVFDKLIGDERGRAFASAAAGGRLLDALLDGSGEVSNLLDELYRNYAPRRTLIVSSACGGCREHRRRGEKDLDYSEPLALGTDSVVVYETSDFAKAFPHLNISAPVLLILPESADEVVVMAALADLVANFNIRELAVPDVVRTRLPALRSLHRRASDGILLLQSLEEDELRPTAYQLPRASLVTQHPISEQLLALDRPLHVIVTRQSGSDLDASKRSVGDIGTNVLTLEQFKLGVQG